MSNGSRSCAGTGAGQQRAGRQLGSLDDTVDADGGDGGDDDEEEEDDDDKGEEEDAEDDERMSVV